MRGVATNVYLRKTLEKLSYLNFFRGPLFVGMRLSFDHFKMFNTHRYGIRKVQGCLGEKSAKNTKIGVYLANRGCVNRLLHPNFFLGSLLITSEGLTPITVESVKFREVSQGKQPKTQKQERG